jgi:hypothetical protein
MDMSTVNSKPEPDLFRPEAVAYRYRARWGYVRRGKMLGIVECVAALLLLCVLVVIIFEILVPGFRLGIR